VIEPSFLALLVAAIGVAALFTPGLRAASGAAITLSAIAVPADPEYGVALAIAANPLPQNHFARSRHRCPRVGLDTGDRL